MTNKIFTTIAIVTLAAACGREAEERAARAMAERDSLVSEVLASAALINQINVELSDLPDSTVALDLTTEGELTAAANENELALTRIRSAIEALGEREAEIKEARERIQTLTSSSSRLSRQIAQYEATINELQAAAERREEQYTTIRAQQREMIAQLTTGLDTARAEMERLGMENTLLADSLVQLEGETSTVYYAIGTERELRDKGIVVSEGSKFLIFGSKTLQPSRELDPANFVAIDKNTVFEIPLPREDKDYRILTRHNPEFLVANAFPNGNIRESVLIDSPEEFWAPSRFLILVQR